MSARDPTELPDRLEVVAFSHDRLTVRGREPRWLRPALATLAFGGFGASAVFASGGLAILTSPIVTLMMGFPLALAAALLNTVLRRERRSAPWLGVLLAVSLAGAVGFGGLAAVVTQLTTALLAGGIAFGSLLAGLYWAATLRAGRRWNAIELTPHGVALSSDHRRLELSFDEIGDVAAADGHLELALASGERLRFGHDLGEAGRAVVRDEIHRAAERWRSSRVPVGPPPPELVRLTSERVAP